MAWNVPTQRARAISAPQSFVEARAHLAGGLVGERHGEDAPRRDALARDEVGDAIRDDARLAAAGAGEDEERALRVGDRGGLRIVELVVAHRSEDSRNESSHRRMHSPRRLERV